MKAPLNKQEVHRILWLDYLRSFIIVLVVAHHASLAYTNSGHFNKEAYIFSSHVVIDECKWEGMDIFVNFNSIFFMSLMFMISGIFVVNGLNKKGPGPFIKERFRRLFVPFIVSSSGLMLIAHYPAFVLATGKHNISDHITDFLTNQHWPAGPPWFIWFLFGLNIIFTITFPVIKGSFNKWSLTLNGLKRRPFWFCVSIFVFTWITYVPMAYNFGPGTWTGYGPFDFQPSRLFLYSGYFSIGAIIGMTPLENGIFSTDSLLVKKWRLWVLIAILISIILTLNVAPIIRLIENHTISEFSAWMIFYTVYAASCTLSCIAFLTAFKALIHSPKNWWNSLSENAFGIYLIHFIPVIWMQYYLLPFEMHAMVKFLIVTIVSMTTSWGTINLIRKNKFVKSYL